jgi:hypothetical protein
MLATASTGGCTGSMRDWVIAAIAPSAARVTGIELGPAWRYLAW